MGKKKTESTYTYAQQPLTQQQQQLGTMVNQGPDATIPFSFAQGRQDATNSYHNPLGAYTSPATANASKNALINTASMHENVATQASTAQNAQGNFARQGVLTSMTMPVNTGGTTTTSGGFWSGLGMQLLGNAISGAEAAATGGGSAAM